MSKREWKSVGREWLSGLLCFSLVIAPIGCQPGLIDGNGLPGAGGLTGTTLDLARASGLFINETPGDGVIAAARNGAGDAFFVFGALDQDGNIARIDTLLFNGADGTESFIRFESGRPVHAQGPDGSYAHIEYKEVSAQRLRASVDLYNAAEKTVDTFPVDIDLEQTAEQIAALVSEVTGRALDTTTITDDGQIKRGTEQVRITFFSPFFGGFVVPLVAAIGTMTIILGQVLTALVEVVLVTVQAVLLAAFSPLFAIAELLSQTVISIRLVPLFDVFALLPPAPVVILFDV